jgi:hypothetical protein
MKMRRNDPNLLEKIVMTSKSLVAGAAVGVPTYFIALDRFAQQGNVCNAIEKHSAGCNGDLAALGAAVVFGGLTYLIAYGIMDASKNKNYNR